MNSTLKNLFYYWFSSLLTAIIGYYMLQMVSSNKIVFGSFFRMHSYHHENPIEFIVIPCFVFGLIATFFSNNFESKTKFKRILITLTIVITTIILSLPLGGFLYFYYDMKAGFFPNNWIEIIISKGFSQAFSVGWFIILVSFPYNILGIAATYIILKVNPKTAYNRKHGKKPSFI
jgi:hypothetical protein